MSKICHLVFEHRLFDGRIFYKEATSLANAGFDVTILAPSIDKKTLGLRKEVDLSDSDTLKINGVTFEYFHYNKIFPKQFGIRHYFNLKAALKKIKEIDADIYHFHESNFLLKLIPTIKEINLGKVVIDIHEMEMHRLREKINSKSNIKRNKKKILDYIKMENYLLENADAFITVSDFLKIYYSTLTDAPIQVLHNAQSKEIFKVKKRMLDKNFFWIGHEGNLRFDRGLKKIIEIAKYIKNPKIKFVFIGKIPNPEMKYLNQKIEEYGLKNKILTTDHLPYEEVANYLKDFSIGLYFTMSKNSRATLSNKFFNYILFSTPILIKTTNEIHKIINKYPFAIEYNKLIPQKIAKDIENLYYDKKRYKEMSKNALEAFNKELNWENQERKLIKLYKGLI